MNKIYPTKSNDPLQILKDTPTCFIVQNPDLVDFFCGCGKVRYDVFVSINGVTHRIFRCKEESTCLSKVCCTRYARSFILPFKFVGSDIGELADVDNLPPYACINKPFSCMAVCLPSCMPPATVTLNKSNNSNQIGSVDFIKCCGCIGKCCSCSLWVEIFSQNGKIFTIEMSTCQLSVCCPCGMSCYDTMFHIYREPNLDTPVGTVKRPRKCISCITGLDNFHIGFPKDATPEEKFLLISGILHFDYTILA